MYRDTGDKHAGKLCIYTWLGSSEVAKVFLSLITNWPFLPIVMPIAFMAPWHCPTHHCSAANIRSQCGRQTTAVQHVRQCRRQTTGVQQVRAFVSVLNTRTCSRA